MENVPGGPPPNKNPGYAVVVCMNGGKRGARRFESRNRGVEHCSSAEIPCDNERGGGMIRCRR